MLMASSLAISGTPGIKYGLHFDHKGKIIRPDEKFLLRGWEYNEDGYKDEAMKNFKLSATYGNANARYFIALLYLQKQDYLNAHSWMNLLNSDYIGIEKIKSLLPRVENYLNQEQLVKSELMTQELKTIYGDYAGLLKREKWRKSIKYGGTHIKGHVPHDLTILTNSNVIVTNMDLRNQIKTFVFEYNDQFKLGEVKLNDVEYIENE